MAAGTSSIASDLTSPPQTLEVVVKPTSLDSPEFTAKIEEFLHSGRIWRSSRCLATALDVDVDLLDGWLRLQPFVASRASKRKGCFLYASLKRLKQTDTRPGPDAKSCCITVLLNVTLEMFGGILDKYALDIHAKSHKAFDRLADAKRDMDLGLLLFSESH